MKTDAVTDVAMKSFAVLVQPRSYAKVARRSPSIKFERAIDATPPLSYNEAPQSADCLRSKPPQVTAPLDKLGIRAGPRCLPATEA